MKKSHTVFIDIETMYSQNKPKPEDVPVPKNYKKEESIKQYQEDHLQEHWFKTALDPIEGRIFCIGIGVDNKEVEVLHGIHEHETLKMLSDKLNEVGYYRIVAHNGMDFDYPFIFLRAVKYRFLNLIKTFTDKNTLEDTMRMLDGTAWKKMISLDRACKLIGIQGKDGMDGSMVPEYILKGKGDQVLSYCAKDVEKLRKIYLALGGTVYNS
jgi:hypothetical protein